MVVMDHLGMVVEGAVVQVLLVVMVHLEMDMVV